MEPTSFFPSRGEGDGAIAPVSLPVRRSFSPCAAGYPPRYPPEKSVVIRSAGPTETVFSSYSFAPEPFQS